jgi:hypothetical protein
MRMPEESQFQTMHTPDAPLLGIFEAPPKDCDISFEAACGNPLIRNAIPTPE